MFFSPFLLGLLSAAIQDPATAYLPDLHPRAYRSPSGEFELFVDFAIERRLFDHPTKTVVGVFAPCRDFRLFRMCR